MVFTMLFFKFVSRKCLFSVMALLLAVSCGAYAESQDKPKPSMDKSGTAAMFLRGGELEAERSNWDAAVEKFQEAIKLEQDSALAHYDLGVAQFHLGQLESACEAEKKAILLDPKLIDAYIQLASIFSKLGDYPGAESILERALKVDEHCKIAKDSLNEICRLKKSNPGLFDAQAADEENTGKHRNDSAEPSVPREKLKHSS